MSIGEKIKELKQDFTNIANAVRENINTNNKLTMEEVYNIIKGGEESVGKDIVERKTNSVILPTIDYIGRYAFYKYTNLENISFPNSVKTIGTQVLKGCNNLERVSIPFVGSQKDGNGKDNFGHLFGGASIYDNRANVPTSLKEVKITGETPIGDGAFYDCKYITKVDMQESLMKDIGILAFYGCNALENVSLPNRIENVGLGAFYGLNNLNYTIVDGIKYLGNEDNPYLYCEGDRINLTRTSINIHEDCKIIGAGAFLGCVFVSSLTIPSSVKYIGDYAFRSCSRLSSVSFGGGSKLKRIGRESFRDCKGVLGMGGLTSITIPNSVEFIDRGAFRGCDKLTSITLPFVGRTAKPNERHSHFGYIFGANGYLDNSKYIPSSLTSVELTNTEYIGDKAFYNCSNIVYLYLPNNVEYIGQDAFYGCSGLYYYDYGNGLKTISSRNNYMLYIAGVFDNYIQSVEIPSTCKFIGKEAFKDCTYLTNVKLSDSLLDIGDYAFEGCTSLEYNVDEYLYYLGSDANPYLCLVGVIGDATRTVVNRCKFISLTYRPYTTTMGASLRIPTSVKVLGKSSFFATFYPFNNTYFSDYEFTRINTLIYNASKNIVNATIRHIGNVFGSLTFDEDVVLKGVETIDASAFSSSTFNGVFDLSNTNITHIKGTTFAYCNFKQGIVLNDKIEVIGQGAFINSEFSGLTIPASVISIEKNAFEYTKTTKGYLGSIRFNGTLDQWATIEFGNANSNPVRYSRYPDIKLYANNKLVSGDITLDKAYKISDYAFYDYRQIKSITIPDTTTSIGASAFENTWVERVYVGEKTLFDFSTLALGGLSDYVTLDEDVGKIKDFAFFNNKLTEFTIPSGCKAIGKKAFNYTSGQEQTLKTLYVKAETPPILSDSATFPPSVERYIVPQGKLSAYQSATNWSYYANKMVEEQNES